MITAFAHRDGCFDNIGRFGLPQLSGALQPGSGLSRILANRRGGASSLQEQHMLHTLTNTLSRGQRVLQMRECFPFTAFVDASIICEQLTVNEAWRGR